MKPPAVDKLTQVFGQLSAPLCGHHPLVVHVTLVPHQQDLGVVPGVCFDLCRPAEEQKAL